VGLGILRKRMLDDERVMALLHFSTGSVRTTGTGDFHIKGAPLPPIITKKKKEVLLSRKEGGLKEARSENPWEVNQGTD